MLSRPRPGVEPLHVGAVEPSGRFGLSGQERYTLEEARQILRGQECVEGGHAWNPIEVLGSDIPTAFVCGRCGRVITVEKEIS